ncbi:6,7-dimethyl-8-ribityllumazine synthase [Marinobacter sp. F3R11]|uniref:6,7-dimethyl-8-ribityllumazine synthase n=1 Tax=Marinobacter sp. F3R11 TaxID=2267231 RepID=UPI000DEA1CDC|nr:6,7-dimethyl-8-ribityllumazine synthase [Marinobacter sp. F3R11]RBW49816.1 6,7-dimethyl-8-ribityllumazine synthase [Marinobacter sp. F3R11]
MSQSVSDKTPDTLFLDNLQKIAIVSSGWHKSIVGNAVKASKEYFEKHGVIGDKIALYELPGAFELPLYVKKLIQRGKFDAIIACGFVVNGGIYKQEYVASAVIDGLMRVQLESGVPVFSAVLTPHYFHEHEDHIDFFSQHFIKKGTEVAEACIQTLESLYKLEKNCA